MPKKLPPHLPAPMCNMESHQKWQRLKILLAATGIGLLAGLSGASMMLGWIWPRYGEGDTWAVSQNFSTLSKAQMDKRVSQEVVDRVFDIYSNATAFGSGSYLREQDLLGEAVAISSDGWLAMYFPSYSGSYKNWQILSSEKVVYNPEKALFDRYTGMIYVKISSKQQTSGLQFKVASFSGDIHSFDAVFVYQNKNWNRSFVNFPVVDGGATHLDTAPAIFYSLDLTATVGSLVVNDQGRVVGFVNKNGLLLPNGYITSVMAGILGQQKITYPSLGVEGWFSLEQPIVINGEAVSGFAVNKVWGKSSPLKKGDVILEINGKDITKEIESGSPLWYNNQAAKLKVLRSGKTLELESPIFQST